MMSYRRGRLFMDGVSVAAAADRFGTPLYLYSKASVLDAYARLGRAFTRKGTLICYALKANPSRGIASLLARQGAGAEVVSGGELLRALGAGFPAGRIVFSGVGKTEEELRLAARRRILSVNLESEGEMDLLERVAGPLGTRVPVSVRLNPGVDAGTHAHVTTGTSADKFGVERGTAMRMYRKAARSTRLAPRGVHCHIGSQVTRVEPFLRAARVVAGLVEDLEREGIRLEHVDLGGGLGVPYEDGPCLGVERLAQGLGSALSRWPDKRLILEPGRYLTADAGALLTRVLYRKKTTERDFVVVDAGMTDLLRPALYGARHPILPGRERGGKRSSVDVVGPVCESADHLARNVRLPPCEPGEVLAVLKAGAYGFSMSSQYNSRPRAAEVLVDGRSARIIRRRETLEDIVRGEA